MNRLWLRLFVAFIAILIVAVGTAWLLASRSVTDQFADYLESEQAARAERVERVFRNYRIQTGSWSGVQALTQRVSELAGEHVVVADADRVVVADSLSYFLGERANPRWQGAQIPITDGGETLGTVYLSPTRPPVLGDLHQRSFIEARNRSLLAASLVGLAGAIVLSIFVARRIARPIEAVTTAARELQRGNLRPTLSVTDQDPAEVQSLGRAFVALARSLERNEQLRRNMVSDIAHELRTPLSNVRGYLEAIQDGMVEPSPEVLEILSRETISLARLVDDLQELSQAEAGQLRMVAEHVLVSELVDVAVQAARANPDAADRQISTEVEPADLQVYADPVRTGQVLRNLLSNAVRYTKPGGHIRISARQTSPGFVAIAVADDGVGIASEDLPLIFERFYRTSAARDRATGGTGLGLTIARQLARAQGGELTVESELGRGSVFAFTLPASSTAATAQPSAEREPRRPRRGMAAPVLGALLGAISGGFAGAVEATLITLQGSTPRLLEVLPMALAINAAVFAALGAVVGIGMGAFHRWRPNALPRWGWRVAAAIVFALPSLLVARSAMSRLPTVADVATATVVPGWLPGVAIAAATLGALLSASSTLLLWRATWRHRLETRWAAGLLVATLVVLTFAAALSPLAQLQPGVSEAAAAAAPGMAPEALPAAVEGRSNLLLITFSSLSAEHSSAYGYARHTTPALSALAESGVRFDSAFTPQPHVLSGHASIMTGQLPEMHGIQGFAGDRLSTTATTLAEILSEAGYDTAAFYSALGPGDPMAEIARGFQRAEVVGADPDPETPGPGPAALLASYQRFSYLLAVPAQLNTLLGIDDPTRRPSARADAITSAALSWLAQRGERPYFLWVHYFDLHGPHAAPDPYSTLFLDDACGGCDLDETIDRLQSGGRLDDIARAYQIGEYDGEVRYVDSQVQRLLMQLERSGQRERTLIIATSSNGLPLGELWPDTPGAWLTDAGVRVPLVLALPGVLPAGMTIADPVQTVDILPTVTDLLGLARPEQLQGQSLLPLIHGDALAPRDIVASLPDRSRLVLITPDWRLYHVPALHVTRLYDRHDNDTTPTDHSAEHPEIVRVLLARLRARFGLDR